MLYIKQISIFIVTTFSILFANLSLAMNVEDPNAYASFIKEIIATSSFERNGEFCIVGNDEVARAIFLQNPEVLRLGEENRKYDKCNVVYISQSLERGLRIELDRLLERKILTIAVFDGFVDMGGMIQVQLGRRNFELTINQKALKVSGIRLDPLMLNLIIN